MPTACIESGEPVYVPAGMTIDLSAWNPELESYASSKKFKNHVSLRIDGEIKGLSIPMEFGQGVNIQGNGKIVLSPNKLSYNNGYFTVKSSSQKSIVEGVTFSAASDEDLNVSSV